MSPCDRFPRPGVPPAGKLHRLLLSARNYHLDPSTALTVVKFGSVPLLFCDGSQAAPFGKGCGSADDVWSHLPRGVATASGVGR
jgi:hypothetical protein